jgi:hypothetical protein
VLLIDEIDKADLEFPNDLLHELDRMEFHVYETGETVRAKHRPIIVITSNNEKELPDAFLRRCFFHYIAFPDRATLQRIVAVHYPNIAPDLCARALDMFFEPARGAGSEEEAVDVGTDRLAQAPARRPYSCFGAGRTRSGQGDSAAVRRADQARAGCAVARAVGVHSIGDKGAAE